MYLVSPTCQTQSGNAETGPVLEEQEKRDEDNHNAAANLPEKVALAAWIGAERLDAVREDAA